MTCLTMMPVTGMALESETIEPELRAESLYVSVEAGEHGIISFTDSTGSVITNKTVEAEEDDSVYFVANPEDEYFLSSIAIFDAANSEISFTEDGQVYCFSMPASDVVIRAEFSYDETSYITEGFSEEAALEQLEPIEEISEEETSEEEITEEEASEEETASMPEESTDAETESETEEVKEDEISPEMKEILSSYDFSSMRLIVSGSEDMFAEFSEAMISSYNGLYMLQFSSQDEAMRAFAKLYDSADFLIVDTAMYVADPTDSSEGSVMTPDGNPFEELKEAMDDAPAISYDIALIDTGAESGNVVNSVSMLGDSVSDDNGHGTKMAELMAEQNPDVRILSIKAFDGNGRADVSAVYAAFEYAISQNVRIINLSASVLATEDNAIIADMIRKATSSGIIVVGAAGNDASNASYFIPGGVYEAFVIGAANESGSRLATSNFGNSVDYNVVADSTSEAAAKFSGFISKNGIAAIADEINGGLIYATDFAPADKLPDYIIVGAPLTYDEWFEICYGADWKSYNSSFSFDLGDGGNHNYRNMYIYETFNWGPGVAWQDYDDYTVSGYIGLGYCVDPDATDFPHQLNNVGVYTNTAYLNVMKALMLLGPGGDYYDVGLSGISIKGKGSQRVTISNNTTNVNASELADEILVHMALGWLEHGGGNNDWSWKMTQPAKDTITGWISDINTQLANPNSDLSRAVAGTTIYIGNPPQPSQQRLIWHTYEAPRAGTVSLTKVSSPETAQNTLTMQGAVYPIYTNAAATTLFVSDGYYWGFKIANNNNAYVARCRTSNSTTVASNWVYYGTGTETRISFDAGTNIWIKELIAPESGNYSMDTSIHAVTIVGNQNMVVSSTDYRNHVPVKIQKSSANPSLTDGNRCYSLEGAVYGLYSDERCTNLITSLTTKADGSTDTYSITAPGTYYLKEISPSPGYLLSTEVKSVTISVLDKETRTVSFTEQPGDDPFGLSLRKVDADTGKPNPSAASTLAGAEFTIKYYDAQTTEETPKNEWTVATGSDAWLNLNGIGSEFFAGYLVSGELYHDNDNNIIWPVGTYTIEETKAPEGYKIDGSVWTDATGNDVEFPLMFRVRVSADNTYGEVVYYDGSTFRPLLGAFIVADESIRGGFSFRKADLDVNDFEGQGDAELGGGTYNIINLNDGKVIVNDTEYDKDAVVFSFETVGSELFESAADLLPYGHYKIVEVASPEGYLLEGVLEKEFDIENDGEIVQLTPDESEITIITEGEEFIGNKPVRGGFKFRKIDSETEDFVPQGDASLTGGKYQVVNMSAKKVWVNEILYNPGDVVFEFVTSDPTAAFESAVNLLPYGRYQINEIEAPEGYKLEGVIQKNFTISENGVLVDLSGEISNPAHRGGVKIQKINEELQKAENEGLSSLEGCVIAIVNASDNQVLVEGEMYDAIADLGTEISKEESSATDENVGYTREELIAAINAAHADDKEVVVKTLTTDIKGFATTDADTLPYGTYYLYEVSANESVQIDEDWVIRIEVREDGVIIDATELPIEDPIVRGDINFNKVNIDGIFRPNVPFLFVALDENGKALEAHVIVTDADGLINTATRDNTNNTNGFDQYVVFDSESKEYYVTPEGEELLQSGEAQTWGIWFSQGRNPETGERTDSKATPNKDRGALYYGNYQIFEIKCEDNTSKGEDLLYSGIIPVYQKDTVVDDFGNVIGESSDKVINYHPFVDLEVVLTSEALDDITKTHVTFVNDELVLTDTIHYTHLKATTTYKWVVKFVETSNPTNVLSTITIDGYVPARSSSNVDTAEGSFTIKTDGTMVNANCASTPEITSSGNVSTIGLDGETISAIVYLYEYTSGYNFPSEELVDVCDFIQSHNLDCSDANELIYVPSLKTLAMDIFTKDNVGTKNENDAIIDSVDLTNLGPKERYLLIETIMDKETGEVFAEAEQALYEFYSNRPDADFVESWHVEMPAIEIDSSMFGAKTLVAFEQLWRIDDDGNIIDEFPVVTHESIIDETQSIHYIDIKTSATDGYTGDHVGTVTEQTTITDTVELFNLIPGMSYTIKGELVYAKDCEDADGVAHEAGEAIEVLDGSEVEKTIIADSDYMTVEITYIIDSSKLEGITVVSTEYAYHNDVLIDSHVDLTDEDQSVHFPKLRTNLSDAETGDDVGTVAKTVTLIDKVTYENLIPSEEYTVSGKLVYQKDCVDSRGIPHKAGDPVVNPLTGEPYTASAVLAADEHDVDGEIEIVFEIDSRVLEGLSIVAEEDLIHNEIVVTSHADLSDDAQTVHFPGIRTSAVDSRTGDHIASIFGKLINAIRGWLGETDIDGEPVAEDAMTSIVDTVALTNLVPGRTYEISGILMNQLTGEPVLIDGEPVTQKAIVTAGEDSLVAEGGERTTVTLWDAEHNSISGTVDLVFSFDASMLMGEGMRESFTVVVFESLFHNDIEVAVHDNIHDEAQTIYGAAIDSVALDANTNSHVGDTPRIETTDERIEDETMATIVETVNYKGFLPGSEYTISGVLAVKEDSTEEQAMFLKADGSVTDKREEGILAEITFVAEEESGSVELTFELDSELVAGKTIVVFDDLIHNGVVIATHSDINDEDQSIHYPGIGTMLRVGGTEYNDSYYNKVVTLIDTVEYTNLIPGLAYEIEGSIIFKDNDEPVTVDGEEIRDHIVFIPSEPNGTVDLAFVFPAAGFEGREIVAYEMLLFAQRIEGAEEGKLYYECECGKLFETVDEWQAHLDSFNLMCHCGEIFLDATELEEHLAAMGTDEDHYLEAADHDTYIQVLEPITGEMILVTTHADINDRMQTVCLPGMKTTLIDVNGTKMPLASENMKLIDTLEYEALTPGNTYTVTGKLIDKETGLPVRDDDGNIITASTTFVAETGSGTVDIIFEFSGLSLAGKSLVAFERLYFEETLVGLHEDVNDEAQTVYVPKVGTVAKFDDGKDSSVNDKDTVIIDTVSYSNLEPGKYIFRAQLMNKKTGEPIMVKGQAITAEVEVEITEGSGEVKVELKIPANSFTGEAVVFEEVFAVIDGENILVGEHKDLEDRAQTVTFTAPVPTGDVNMTIWLIVLGVAILGIVGFAIGLGVKSKKKSPEEE